MSSRGSRAPTSNLESTITRLLVATKQLLEGLAKWSRGDVSEQDISTIYVKLGNDFNVAVSSFQKEGISMEELLSVPADLRYCLEQCLSDEPSQATLERHLPQVRQIIIGLLQGLRVKQQMYRDGVALRKARAAELAFREQAARDLADAPPRRGSSSNGSAIGGPVGGARLLSRAQAAQIENPLSPGTAGRSREELRKFVSQANSSTSSAPGSGGTSQTNSRSNTPVSAYTIPPIPASNPLVDDGIRPGGNGLPYPRQSSPPRPSSRTGGLPSGPRPRAIPSENDRRIASYDETTLPSTSTSFAPPVPFKHSQSLSQGSSTRGSNSIRDSTSQPRSPISIRDSTTSSTRDASDSYSLPYPQSGASLASSFGNALPQRKNSRPHSPPPSIPPPMDPPPSPRPRGDSLYQQALPVPNNPSSSSLSVDVRPPSSESFHSTRSHSHTRESSDQFSPAEPTSTQSAAQLESLESLKAGESLARRASKRFSAYSFQKMTTGSSPSRAALGAGGNDVVTSRGEFSVAGSGAGGSDGKRRAPTSAGRELSQANNLLGVSENRRTSGRKSGEGSSGKRPAMPPLPASMGSFDSLPASSSITTIAEEASPRIFDSFNSSTSTIPHTQSSKNFAKSFPTDSSTTAESSPLAVAHTIPTSSPHDSLPRSEIESESEIPEYPMSIYLQIGKDVKKASLDGPPTISTLRLLFIERFAYNPGPSDFPNIYLRDPVIGIEYELEEMADLKSGSVLSLNIDKIEQVKLHIDQGMSGLLQEIKELRSTVASIRRASTLNTNSLSPSVYSSPTPVARPSDKQFHEAAQTIIKNRLTSVPSSPNVPATSGTSVPPSIDTLISPSTSAPLITSPSTVAPLLPSGAHVVTALKSQHEEVQNLRREVGVLRQVYADFVTSTKETFANLRTQTNHVQSLANTGVSASRAFVEAGKTKLETEAADLVVRGDDLQDIIDQVRIDIVSKGIRPRPGQLAEITSSFRKATQAREDLVAWIGTIEPAWKATWNKELATIVEEQKMLNAQKLLLEEDLKMDFDDLASVLAQIKSATEAIKKTPRALREFVPVPASEDHHGISTVMSEVKGLTPDVNRRLEAIAKAERARELEKSAKKDEFAEELGGFVTGNRLKKSGGVEETERLRQARSQQTLRKMFEAPPPT